MDRFTLNTERLYKTEDDGTANLSLVTVFGYEELPADRASEGLVRSTVCTVDAGGEGGGEIIDGDITMLLSYCK